MRLIALLFAATLTALAGGEPLRINFYAGDSLGGFGDIASNVVMARMFRREHPDAVLHMIVPDQKTATNTSALLSTLDPRFKVGVPTQTIDGITYVLDNGATALPKADYLLSFSSKESESPQVLASANKAMLIAEYGLPRPDSAPVEHYLESKVSETTVRRARAGLGTNQLGLFVSQQKPAPQMTREAMFDLLDGIPGRFNGGVGDRYGEVKLGFCYSSDARSTERYLAAMADSARKSPGEKFLLIIQKSIPPNVAIPPNVEIRSYSKIPFTLTEAIVAHSDVPLMLTGSVSASLALEYEKPFFYEAQSWKQNFFTDLKAALIRHNPKLAKYESQLDDLKLTAKDRDLPQERERDLGRPLRDADFWVELRAAMVSLRKVESLSHNLGRFIELEKAVGGVSTTPELHAAFAAAKSGADAAALRQQLAALPPPEPRAVRAAEPASAPVPAPEPEEKPRAKRPRKAGWWNGELDAVVEALRSAEPPKRREMIGALGKHRTPAEVESIVVALGADPAILPQLKSIPFCREILAKAQ